MHITKTNFIANGTSIDKQIKEFEEQIKEQQKITDHEIREFPVSVIVDKFTTDLETDEAELYIPDYQREFIWTVKQQSRFIESLLLNLPIPYLFVADTSSKDDGRLEIVDGSQRIRTLVNFMKNDLQLSDLKNLTSANGLRYKDFPKSRQLRFNRKTIRMIELTEQADEEARREIFDRLNSGGVQLNYMEQRQGSSDDAIYPFIKKLIEKYNNKGEKNLLRTLCPISPTRESRAEYNELLLRFFAYTNNYLNFNHNVFKFLEDYARSVNDTEFENLENELDSVLEYVNSTFPYGFKKKQTDHTTPRIRFEAIAVGTALALRIKPNLSTQQNTEWLNSEEFIKHTRSDASNSKPKVKARIEYVRDKLLGK
ncbi:DUF262 domain-containing protein [Snodgrassella alvi]|uniref:DUF262 domain-containing protein n=1 Tax=Snodgrassella alvi TaxID=1196083 RepID=UPI00352F1335